MNDFIVAKAAKLFLAVGLSAVVLFALQATSAPADAGTSSAAKPSANRPARTIELRVTEKGYEPSPIKVKAGEPLKLLLTRVTDHTCATEIIIDEHDINVPLPLNQQVTVAFTPKKAGTLRYGCAMGKMISGVITVE